MKRIYAVLFTLTALLFTSLITPAQAAGAECKQEKPLEYTPIVKEDGWVVVVEGTEEQDSIVVNLDETPFKDAREIYVYGKSGNDVLCVEGKKVRSEMRVHLYGGDGNDVLKGHPLLRNRLYGEYGNDKLYGGAAKDNLYGGFRDIKVANTGTDLLFGYAERDVLYAGSNDGSVLYGGEHNDVLLAYDYSSAKLYGESGRDTLIGSIKKDVLNGGDGNDRIYVSSKRNANNKMDVLDAGNGKDVVFLHNVVCKKAVFLLDLNLNADDTVWLTNISQQLCFVDLSNNDKVKLEETNNRIVS